MERFKLQLVYKHVDCKRNEIDVLCCVYYERWKVLKKLVTEKKSESTNSISSQAGVSQ